MGMAHRGRLSVIREFLGKSLTVMFAEFSENFLPNTVSGDGDVPPHAGGAVVGAATWKLMLAATLAGGTAESLSAAATEKPPDEVGVP